MAGVRPRTWRPYWPVPVIFVLAIAALATLWQTLKGSHDQALLNQFEFETRRISNKVANHMLSYGQMLRGASGLLAAKGGVSREEWRRYVAELEPGARLKEVLGLGYALNLGPGQVATVERQAREEGLASFHVWPGGKRDTLTTILYLEPFNERNRSAIGFDMYSNPVRRAAMARARDTGQIAYSSRVTLVQEIRGPVQAGFLVYLPVYTGSVAPLTVEARRAALRGWVYMPFRAGDLMGNMLKGDMPGVRLEVFDGVGTDADTLLYDSNPALAGGQGNTPGRDFVLVRRLELEGGTWTLRFTALPNFWPSLSQDPLWVQMGALFAIAFLLVGITWAYISRRHSEDFALALSRSLQASEARLRAIFDQASVGIVLVDAVSLDFTEFNNTACNMLGYPREAMGRLKLTDIQARLSPSEVRSRIRSVIARHEVPAFENRHRMKSGEERDVLVFNGHVHLDGRDFILAVWQDITERKKAEAERSELADLNHKIIFESTQGILVFRADGPCILANDAACRIFGGTREEMLSKNFRTLSPWRQYGLLAAALESLALNARTFRETRYVSSFGREAWVACDFVPFRSGGLPHLLFLVSDVTEFREAEQAMRRARDLADEANRAKGDFLSNMSHEIRTPMNTILGMAQLLQRSDLSGEQAGMVRNIRLAGNAMLSVINDILDYSRIEAGHLPLERRPFMLASMLDTAAAIVSPLAADKGLDFQVRMPAKPLAFQGDRRRLEQVLVNLLGNAVKFTEQGKVSLEVEIVEDNEAWARLRFHVSDTGIGIPPEKLDRIFAAFEQADASTTRRFGGSGLGLSISRRLMEAMGGTLVADSVPGRGSVFTAELKLDHCVGDMACRDDGVPMPGGRRLSGFSVLLVDDSRMNQDVARRLLESEGARVETADDGAIALGRLTRSPGAFDVVLMDLHMPVMDGFEATSRIRLETSLAGLPVVAVSAGVMPEQEARARQAGVDAFLGKPYDLETMVATLRALRGDAQVEAPCAMEDGEGLPRVDGIVPSEAALRLGKDRPLFVSLLRRLGEEFGEIGSRVRADLARGDASAAHGRLHKLKGSAGNVGAMEVARLVARAEEGVSAAAPEAEWLPPLERALQQVLAAAEGLPRLESGQFAPMAEDELELALAELMEALDKHSLKALKLFEGLKSGLEVRYGSDAGEELVPLLAALDFGRAAEKLRKRLAA